MRAVKDLMAMISKWDNRINTFQLLDNSDGICVHAFKYKVLTVLFSTCQTCL